MERGRRDAFPGQLREACEDVLQLPRPLQLGLRLALEELSPPPQDRDERRVVIVRGSRDVELSWGGYGSNYRGLDLSESYRRYGWEVREAVPSGSSLPNLGRWPPHVIHIAARLEVSGGIAWFEASDEDSRMRHVSKGSSDDTGLFVTQLLRWLEPLRRRPDSAPPVVVLDPLVPPQGGDLLPLLTARNRFAADLYLDGLVMAVVAGGLPGQDPVAVQGVLLEGLEAGASLLDIVGSMRENHGDPRSPAALFAPSARFRLSTG